MRIDTFMQVQSTTVEKTNRHSTSRGKYSGILISGTKYNDEELTVRLRSKKGIIPICTSLPMGFLSAYSDLKFGLRAHRTLAGILADIKRNVDTVNATGSGLDWYGLNEYAKQFPRGVYVPIGHVTLDEDYELEVIYKTAAHEDTLNIDIYGVHLGDSADIIRLYDQTQDYDTTHALVREAYFYGDNAVNFISKEGVASTLNFQIDGDRGSNLFDCNGILSATNIFGSVEALQIDNLLMLLEDTEPVPGEYRFKVTGSGLDRENHSFVFIKEVVPTKVSDSTVTNLSDALRRIEKLEREAPEVAKAYRHAGVMPKADVIKAQVEQLKASNEADKI